MSSNGSLPPTTVAAFLQLHDLERYAEAFEDEGWDSLPQLQGMDEAGLMQLITDVKMKSGHAARLRKALGMQLATGPAPVEPPANQQAQMDTPPVTPAADGAQATTGTLTDTAAHSLVRPVL